MRQGRDRRCLVVADVTAAPQPLCDECWTKAFNPPERVRWPDSLPSPSRRERFLGMKCCMCGRRTSSGIFVRFDPETVPFPRDGD